jgi:hypothetical protein
LETDERGSTGELGMRAEVGWGAGGRAGWAGERGGRRSGGLVVGAGGVWVGGLVGLAGGEADGAVAWYWEPMGCGFEGLAWQAGDEAGGALTQGGGMAREDVEALVQGRSSEREGRPERWLQRPVGWGD